MLQIYLLNKPFSSCPKPPFQSEAKCEAIDIKSTFYSHAKKLILLSASFWEWESLELVDVLLDCTLYYLTIYLLK